MLDEPVVVRSVDGSWWSSRRAVAVVGVLATVAAACAAESEPVFGSPSSIQGRVLPGTEGTTSASSSSGDGGTPSGPVELFEGQTDPPAPTRSATEAHAGKSGAPSLSSATSCAISGCHGPDMGERAWAIAGYVEKGGKPGAGVVVAVVSEGKRIAATADANGYFWAKGPLVGSGDAAVRAPGGSVKRMNTKLANGHGNCTQAGCHLPAGSQGGAIGSIFAP